MEPLGEPTTPLLRVPRRTPRACKQCRASKIKCSGSRPCDRCTRRREACLFPSDEPHVSVPERYLRDLQRRVSQLQAVEEGESQEEPQQQGENGAAVSASIAGPAPSRPPSPLPPSHHPHPLLQQSQPHNPLVSRDLAYVQESNGRPRYLGPTSTWSFCRRALSLLERHRPSSGASSSPLNTDGTAFRLRWEPKAAVGPEDVKDLPPRDFALHLYSTAKFHLGDLFGAVDEVNLLAHLDRFHQDPLCTAQTERLWFITYLLLLAFGKAFLASGPGLTALPGSQYAVRALSLLPDPAHMHDVPSPSIGVLALAALYLQSIDMRSSAYQFIGQALRLCYIEGIHHHISEHVINSQFASRCSDLWWTVYVLDQEITANMGCPSAVPEGVVAVALPSEVSSDLSAKAMTLRIRLSRLTAIMCSTLYSVGEGLGNSFVRTTTSFLQQLAEVSRELDTTTSSFNHSSNSDVPHTFRHITLSYHHCIILATRPLVMWFLVRRAESAQLQPLQLADPVAALLKTSAESAMTIVTILHTLAEQDMLECFLPFQLDYVFAAAMLLLIMETLLPSYIPDGDWSSSVDLVFETMIMKKNAVASLRKSEIKYLHTLLLSLRSNNHTLIQDQHSESNTETHDTIVALGEDQIPTIPDGDFSSTGLDLPWASLSNIGNTTFSNSDQLLELAEQFQDGALDPSWLLDPHI